MYINDFFCQCCTKIPWVSYHKHCLEHRLKRGTAGIGFPTQAMDTQGVYLPWPENLKDRNVIPFIFDSFSCCQLEYKRGKTKKKEPTMQPIQPNQALHQDTRVFLCMFYA